MPTATVGIPEGAYQRLLHLVEQTGRPAGAILEQALADYETKVAGATPLRPVAAEEAEILEDVGRIRMAPRSVERIVAHVLSAPRRPPRLGADPED